MSDATQPTIPQVTPASAWQSKGAAGKTEDVPLPSGNVAKLRRPGMEAFITAGIIPNSLLEIITKTLEKAKGDDKAVVEIDVESVETLFSDPTKFNDVLSLVDNCLVYCVVEPKVKPTSYRDDVMARDDLSSSEKEALTSPYLYPDMVDMDDKFFIFSYAVGGTRDLERFRGELAASVANVWPGEAVGDSA